MNDDFILKLYKEGYSIDFIVDTCYKNVNSKCLQNYFHNGNLVIVKKETKKIDVRRHVEQIIFDYVKKLFKEE